MQKLQQHLDVVSCACFRMTGNSAVRRPFPVMVKQAHNISDQGQASVEVPLELSWESPIPTSSGVKVHTTPNSIF